VENYMRFFLALGVALTLMSCTEDIRFINVAPSVTSIGPIENLGDNEIRVFLTIQDFESDPVDIEVTLQNSAGNILAVSVVPGKGHGVVGLSSTPSIPGTLHELFLEANPEDGDVTLSITPDDFEGGPGLALTTPEFNLAEGLESTYIP